MPPPSPSSFRGNPWLQPGGGGRGVQAPGTGHIAPPWACLPLASVGQRRLNFISPTIILRFLLQKPHLRLQDTTCSLCPLQTRSPCSGAHGLACGQLSQPLSLIPGEAALGRGAHQGQGTRTASWRWQQLKEQAGKAGRGVGRAVAASPRSITYLGPGQQRDLEGVAGLGPKGHKESAGKPVKASSWRRSVGPFNSPDRKGYGRGPPEKPTANPRLDGAPSLTRDSSQLCGRAVTWMLFARLFCHISNQRPSSRSPQSSPTCKPQVPTTLVGQTEPHPRSARAGATKMSL